MITVTAEIRTALARHDITTAYRLLIESGIPQREIAQATGQSQSEVSDIRSGRRVLGYDVLVRIADGLGVERGLMGLGWEPTGQYDETSAHATGEPGAEEVSEAVKRRNFINAVAGAVVAGHPVLRELLDAPSNAPAPVFPTKLGASDVTALRDLTATMRTLARQYGGQADAIGTTARNYTRLLTVPGTDAVKAQLGSALAELHTVAGWACFDAGLSPDTVRAHFTRGMELATKSGDTYQAVDAIYHAAMATQNAAPDDSLKLLQLGTARLGHDRSHPRTETLRSWLHVDSAHSLLMLGERDQARSELAAGREGWNPADRFDAADMDHVTALAHQELGLVDSAEQLAVSSVQKWGTEQRRDAVQAETTLAVLYVQSGDSRGTTLAQRAIDDVAALQSKRARARLAPLGRALAARRDSTAQDLTRRVRELQTA